MQTENYGVTMKPAQPRSVHRNRMAVQVSQEKTGSQHDLFSRPCSKTLFKFITMIGPEFAILTHRVFDVLR